MAEFKRENRYLVVKWWDVEEHLSIEEQQKLDDLLIKIEIGRSSAGKDPCPEFVCVKHSWHPEYEQVWKMIEARVNEGN